MGFVEVHFANAAHAVIMWAAPVDTIAMQTYVIITILTLQTALMQFVLNIRLAASFAGYGGLGVVCRWDSIGLPCWSRPCGRIPTTR